MALSTHQSSDSAATAKATESPDQALALVRFEGPDAATFLQGYLTCDLTHLIAGSSLPAALLSLKGRITCNGWAFLLGDPERGVGSGPVPDSGSASGVGMLCHESVADSLLEGLARYLAFSKTEATRAAQPPVVSSGPAAVRLSDELWLDWNAASADRLTGTELWARLTAAQQVLVQADTADQFLPQMLGLNAWGAIDFDKGCYLGQEVVARAQHRGAVKRRLTPLRWPQPPASDRLPPVGTALVQNGRSVGTLVQTSAEGALAVVKAGLLPASTLKTAPAADAPDASPTEIVTEFLLP